jgi:uncharacterized membrane protein YdbT with pleckstrin-like domain
MARPTKAQQAAIDQQAIKDAQQAELKRLRAEKAAAKKAERVATIKAMAVDAEEKKLLEAKLKTFDPKEEARKRMEQMASTIDSVLADFEMPSWKRLIATTIVSLVLAAGAGWMIGTLTGMLIVSAVALTGMAWIGYVIWALGMLLAFYAGMKIGQHVGNYILSGTIDKHIGSVKDRFVGLFTSSKVEVTGAFVPGAAA